MQQLDVFGCDAPDIVSVMLYYEVSNVLIINIQYFFDKIRFNHSI